MHFVLPVLTVLHKITTALPLLEIQEERKVFFFQDICLALILKMATKQKTAVLD